MTIQTISRETREISDATSLSPKIVKPIVLQRARLRDNAGGRYLTSTSNMETDEAILARTAGWVPGAIPMRRMVAVIERISVSA